MISKPVGTYGQLAIDIIGAAPAEADVDLSVACMFEHEEPGSSMSGGLLHLDRALKGALTTFRREGVFRARYLETLFLAKLPVGVVPRNLLVIGLGDPDRASAEILERAVATAANAALRLKVRTVAFAPDLLDAGIPADRVPGREFAMLKGLFETLAAENSIAARGLTWAMTLEHWSFDSGVTHMDSASAGFAEAFTALRALYRLGFARVHCGSELVTEPK